MLFCTDMFCFVKAALEMCGNTFFRPAQELMRAISVHVSLKLLPVEI